jgi:SAM-dependent methyltransferase
MLAPPMSYTIAESNAERQILLAKFLNGSTEPILRRAAVPPSSRCLDIGAGQGNTTRLIHRVWQASETVGVEFDPALVAHARGHEENSPGVSFTQGNAMQLDFPDNSFDAAFTRYLLLHLPDPDAAIRELARVVKPGGVIVSYEPDMRGDCAHPHREGVTFMTQVWQSLFAFPFMGRELVHRFRAAGLADLDSGVLIQMEQQDSILKRIYRLTLEATKPALLAKGVFDEPTIDSMHADLVSLEADPSHCVYKFPDMWIIARV